MDLVRPGVTKHRNQGSSNLLYIYIYIYQKIKKLFLNVKLPNNLYFLNVKQPNNLNYINNFFLESIILIT